MIEFELPQEPIAVLDSLGWQLGSVCLRRCSSQSRVINTAKEQKLETCCAQTWSELVSAKELFTIVSIVEEYAGTISYWNI
ncbi:hypothetical protein D5086_019806 [Populus alba]|uniref:Uncharacterized protein n=1 Tax=Populus alba TaxID=43335 RepID=A0ACC4BJM5_POPAL